MSTQTHLYNYHTIFFILIVKGSSEVKDLDNSIKYRHSHSENSEISPLEDNRLILVSSVVLGC